MKRVEFRLTIPRAGSWNGEWSGKGMNYVLYKNLPDKKCEELYILGRDWYHSWEDGWEARITSRVLAKGERKQKSAGFCGYEWMVNNILKHGHTRKDA